MKTLILLSTLLFVLPILNAQTSSFKVWVELSDKDNSPFSVDRPEEFLTQKAIDRRSNQNIHIQRNDLPVNPTYVDQIVATGAIVRHRSKWFNALSIEVADSAMLSAILALPFVKDHQRVAKYSGKMDDSYQKLETAESELSDYFIESRYGPAIDQLKLVNGHKLHQKGLLGKGMTIAVMDAGFTNVTTNRVFRYLLHEQRILGQFDMVSGGKISFDKHGHGANVLSVLAAYIPYTYIGSAPEANYYLFRTEDGSSELLVEEDNWIAAAEKADSLGVDVINTSLGYTEFQDSTMDHVYEDLDGNTTRITRGADIAAGKGILVVNSAGNQGATDWRYISVPADGDSVLAVGAVNIDSNVVGFSSRGPSADGDIKPNVCALGAGIAVVLTNEQVGTSNGTSFSGPVIAGLATCLWQAFPERSSMEIFNAIQESAHLFDTPNDDFGYGIPDFEKAYNSLADDLIEQIGPQLADVDVLLYPNPVTENLRLFIHARQEELLIIEIYDLFGHLVFAEDKYIAPNAYDEMVIADIGELATGDYILRVVSSGETEDIKFTKIPR